MPRNQSRTRRQPQGVLYPRRDGVPAHDAGFWRRVLASDYGRDGVPSEAEMAELRKTLPADDGHPGYRPPRRGPHPDYKAACVGVLRGLGPGASYGAFRSACRAAGVRPWRQSRWSIWRGRLFAGQTRHKGGAA